MSVERRALSVGWAALVVLGACGAERESSPVASDEKARAPAPAQEARALAPAAPLAGSSPDCPGDMAAVEGAYCSVVEQVCIEWQESFGEGGRKVKNQCSRFAAPTRCLVPNRAPMRFCMDRFEWPNERGALPRVLVSWRDAQDLCASRGKRLCTEAEFNLACEGDEMLPYVYGFERDPSKCNLDKPYRPRTFTFAPYDECLSRPDCRAALEAIDQRVPAGSMEACQSKQAIFDLNGNVNEWVILPDKGVSHRAGLKGGWWGPVRNRCRPTVTFHGESDFGYEVGFRCCKDAGAPAAAEGAP